MFSLFEWLFLGVFFLVLIAIALPNNTVHHEINKEVYVKSNMHKFQTILETYAVDANGNYPKNVEELHKFASTGNNQYWKDFRNPFNNQIGKEKSYDDLIKTSKKTKKIEGFFFDEKFIVLEGKMGIVYYDPILNKKGQVFKYFIYGGGKNNELIFNSQTNETFTLSNN
ncbi:MAG: hypothetical protein AABZ74_12330 [Cyanobacteriota bacterium]